MVMVRYVQGGGPQEFQQKTVKMPLMWNELATKVASGENGDKTHISQTDNRNEITIWQLWIGQHLFSCFVSVWTFLRERIEDTSRCKQFHSAELKVFLLSSYFFQKAEMRMNKNMWSIYRWFKSDSFSTIKHVSTFLLFCYFKGILQMLNHFILKDT